MNADPDGTAADDLARRRRYADTILAAANVTRQPRLHAAFATVPREHFLGVPPWRVLDTPGRIAAETDALDAVYRDVLVALAPERGINNGQPSLHARCLAAVDPQPGETVLHVGAGTGYYTALLAELVGHDGRVIGYEIEPDIAQAAAANLARRWPQAEVRAASAAEGPLPPADVVYVSAGATHPVPAWLDALAPGGRLVFPLTADSGWGCMLWVKRLGERRYAARALMRVAFIPCVGARDAAASASIAEAIATRPLDAVRSLHRGSAPDASAWAAGRGWWLSTADPPSAGTGPG